MKGVVRLRRGRPMLLVDASADGSLIDHRVASLDGVFLYTVADLAAITRDAPWARLGTDDARERFLPMRFALSPCRRVKARVLISRGVLPT